VSEEKGMKFGIWDNEPECTTLHLRGDVTTQGEHIKLFVAVCEVGFVAEINKVLAVDNSKLFFFSILSLGVHKM